MKTSGLGLVLAGLGLDTVGLVNITDTHGRQSQKDIRRSGDRVDLQLATMSTLTSCQIQLCCEYVAKTGDKLATKSTISATESTVLVTKLKRSTTVDFVAYL